LAQHFLLSAKARSLSLAIVLRMEDRDAEALFAQLRWPETDGKPVCPHCECPTCYEARRPNGALRFRCKACRKDFSFARAGPVAGTPAEAYLRGRGVTARLDTMSALRFHLACFYREREGAPGEAWPALLAAVTDPAGAITGVHRTWLDRDGIGKAPVASPRRAMGHLLGNAVRLGGTAALDVLAAGEGIETVLSLAGVLPGLPLVAALSANHLAALDFPPGLRRLYVARDNDGAGRHATVQLRERARAARVEVRVLRPALNDFNADLRAFGADALLTRVRDQLAPDDARRFAP
jgi:Toprim domain/Transposase zinc-ribbon domain